MNPLYRQAIVRSVFGTAFFIALIFWPAGTFHYWQGWLFLAVFAATTTCFGVYLAMYDKPLLERRLKAGPQHEQAWSQKIIVSLVFVAFFALIVVPALDTVLAGRLLRHGFLFSAICLSCFRSCLFFGSS